MRQQGWGQNMDAPLSMRVCQNVNVLSSVGNLLVKFRYCGMNLSEFDKQIPYAYHYDAPILPKRLPYGLHRAPREAPLHGRALVRRGASGTHYGEGMHIQFLLRFSTQAQSDY